VRRFLKRFDERLPRALSGKPVKVVGADDDDLLASMDGDALRTFLRGLAN
jgi:hypothetical protein